MGRRKERRAAASMASGRRVKLDLFAEPSGEKSNEIEEDVNNNRVEEGEGKEKEKEIPNSQPSSSSSVVSLFSSIRSRGAGGGFGRFGKRQDNPLLLLGQYSDEEANEEPMQVSPQKASADQIAQVEEFVVGAFGNAEDTMVDGFAVQHVEPEELDTESAQLNSGKDEEGNGVQESGVVPLDYQHKGDESSGLVPDPWTFGLQTTGEVAFGWKLVMHEQTNQYYYWNIETGETSWEVPAIFTQGTYLGTEQKVPPVIEERDCTPSNTNAYCTLNTEPVVYSSVIAGDQRDGAFLISNDEEKCEPRDQLKIKNERCTDENVVYPELGSSIHQTEQKSTGIKTSTGSEGIDEHSLIANEHPEAGLALCTRLVSYAENLIQKLKDLERSGIPPQGWDWISKYILEIEIRLSDFKSLFSCGSSLLPFWMYSEEKLKGLERAINDHISHLTKSGHTNEADTGQISCYREDSTSHQGIGGYPELNSGNQAVVPNLHSSPNIDTSVIQKEAEDKSTLNDVNVEHILPSVSPFQCVGSVVKENIQEVNETLPPKGLFLQSVPYAAEDEDEDMDVDMEVDDETITNDQRSRDALGAECLSPPEHFNQPDPPGELPPSVIESEYDVPPLPDEDWIPPPPSDTEPIPPPPPDDPPAPTYAPEPPYSVTVPHLPYAEQYNMSYPVPGSEYYVSSTTEVPCSNYYAHAEEPQAVESQSAQYFDTTSTAYSETTSVLVNPMDPLVYYDLPTGPVPPVTVVSCFESSGFYGESGAVSYHDATADQTGTLQSLAEPQCSSLPNLKGESDAFAIGHETEMLAAQIPPLSTTVQATTIAAPVPLTTAASGAVPPSTSAAKASTKVLRSKKRTIAAAPSLRSNKKVSSLVDKWKAAKEELHEDEEDEPQSAFEMLERKRQREIEEWRAHQIATGEAKDNANFQPLGGDWRERVKKRRRAKFTGESVRNLPEAPMDGKQPPDLTEFSRDLPPGWQVYWDESSKKTYYGNTITMETTWTKPTQ